MVKLKNEKRAESHQIQDQMIDLDPLDIKMSGWIERYSSIFPYAALLVGVVLIVTYYLLSMGESELAVSYQRADTAYRQLIQNPSQKDAFEKLYLLDQNHDQLKTKYDSFLAELSFVYGENAQGINLGERVLKRTKGLVDPSIGAFTFGTLALEKGENDPALAQAEKLEANLSQHENYPVLRAFNLLRIASIYKRLGEKEKALAAWQNYQSKIDPATQKLIETHFQLGNASLEGFFR